MSNVIHIPQLEGLLYWDKVLLRDGIAKSYPEAHANGLPMILPVKLKLESWSDYWLLPVEPLVSISGGNVIAKRTVAKGKLRGSIKEYWAQDDYKITITGMLIDVDDQASFPEAALQLLREVCEAREAVSIECDFTKFFDVYKVVVESFDFPFTPGENRQAYTLNLVSDDLTDILTEEDQL